VQPDLSTVAEAAKALRRLLAAIEEREINADGPLARALQRRLDEAATAWEMALGEGAAEPEWRHLRRGVGCPTAALRRHAPRPYCTVKVGHLQGNAGSRTLPTYAVSSVTI
jgi:hypothetical protein